MGNGTASGTPPVDTLRWIEGRLTSDILPDFEEMRQEIRQTWRTAVCMSKSIYVLLFLMAILAVVTSFTDPKGGYAVLFGGITAATFLGTLIWRPYDNVLRATLAVEGMETIIVGLEVEWAACAAITAPADREWAVVCATNLAMAQAVALMDKLVPAKGA